MIDHLNDVDPDQLDAQAWKAARDHVQACEDAHWAADQIANPEDWPESPASATYDGCDTCVMRETLYGAWPVIEAGIRKQVEHELRAGEIRPKTVLTAFVAGILWGWLGFSLGVLIASGWLF